MNIVVPAQTIHLRPCDNDGRYQGEIRIGDAHFHVEAYALDTSSDTTDDLIRDVDRMANFGEPLATMQIDGRDCILVAFPQPA